MMKKSTTKEFITKAKLIHGNKFDYSNVHYIKAIRYVKIICKIHGEFNQTPNQHLCGAGCPKCAGRHKTTSDFIQQAKQIHGNKFDYSKSQYVGATNKLKIICHKHESFLQTPDSHLHGSGCPKCQGEKTSQRCIASLSDFIKKAQKVHKNKFKYTKSIYHGNELPTR